MGIAERKERERKQRRNDILDAAEKVFFKKGFNQATMDELAEEAELSKGTLYLYFENKEDVYFGICHRALILLMEMFKGAVNNQTRGIEKVRAIGQAYYRYAQTYEKYFNTIAHYEMTQLSSEKESPLARECNELGRQMMQVVAGAIQAGMDDGSLRNDLVPVRAAYLLRGQSTGVIQLLTREEKQITEIDNINPEDLMKDFMDMMNHALKSND